MEVQATLKYARFSTRKTRLIVDVVRGLPVVKAEVELSVRRLKAAPMVLKLLRSAVANAVNNEHLAKDNLFVKRVMVNAGPVLKRYTPKAHGRATLVRKPTTHVTIVLAEIKPTVKPVKKDKTLVDETAAKATAKSMEKKMTGKKTTEKKEANSESQVKTEKKSKEVRRVNQGKTDKSVSKEEQDI